MGTTQASPVHHPVVMAQARRRAEDLQLRIADKITAFAGSMTFLPAFGMIGQNRQAAFQQAKADHDFVEQETELTTDRPNDTYSLKPSTVLPSQRSAVGITPTHTLIRCPAS